jgi:transposase
MIGERKAMSIHQEIARLRLQGVGKKKIARTLGIGVETVRGICKEQECSAIGSVPASVNSERARDLIQAQWFDRIPWSELEVELSKPYATVKSLWQEWAPEVKYLRFWRQLTARIEIDPATRARIRFHYQPGERFEMDYCDGFLITDRKTGKTQKTHLFVCVSAASDYTFGEFVSTQRNADFIGSQERCFAYFGGVPKTVVIDNLKSGVKTAHRYDPEVNPKYFEYARHMGFVVIPARPYTPRDKPAIEATVGVIQRQFFAIHRNRIFYSLHELNLEFKKYLEELNTSKMKERGISRRERFLDEIAALKELPSSPFESAEYKTAKVHQDCHVQVQNNFYSIPYRYIGQEVRVKVTDRLIEVFSRSTHESIAVHVRLKKRGEFSTNPDHYPERKLVEQRLDIVSMKRRASHIGGSFEGVILKLLESSEPLRFFRRIQGLFRLVGTQSREAIEFSCTQALTFNRLDYRFIENLIHRFVQNGHSVMRGSVASPPVRDPGCIYLHQIKTEEALEGPEI